MSLKRSLSSPAAVFIVLVLVVALMFFAAAIVQFAWNTLGAGEAINFDKITFWQALGLSILAFGINAGAASK